MGASQGADIGHISIHALLAESDCENSPQIKTSSISIHALLAESDSRRVLGFVDPDISIHAFLAESDMSFSVTRYRPIPISIHALLAESDLGNVVAGLRTSKFLSTLSLRRATGKVKVVEPGLAFLSTLSLRRAPPPYNLMIHQKIFYPRSPCGERLRGRGEHSQHHHFYPRSPCGERLLFAVIAKPLCHFYPRSPCGERHLTDLRHWQVGHFYPRSPCGERPLQTRPTGTTRHISIHALLAESDTWMRGSRITYVEFLSTLSLRRATLAPKQNTTEQRNFYPRSPCGERHNGIALIPHQKNFYPRSPCGERRNT